MSSSLFAVQRRPAPSAGFVSVDLTNAVLIEEFLASCRFWLLIGLLLSFASVWVVQGSPLFPYVLLPLIVFFYLLARRQMRHPDRHVLRAWVWLLILVCAMVSPLAFIAFLRSVTRDFSAELLLPLAAVLLFFWICRRTLKARETMSDRPERVHFLTLGLDGSGPSDVTSKILDEWLSGGYRSMVILLHAWVLGTLIMEAKAVPCCIYLAFAIGCALAIPWFLLPVRRALRDDSAVALLYAAARNRAQQTARQRFFSFPVFAMFHTLMSEQALMWLLLAALLVSAAAVFYAQATGIVMFGFADEGLRSLTGLAAFGLVAAAFLCHRRSRGYAMQHAATHAAADPGEFSLYLRSFIDDQVEVLRDGLFFRVWFVDPLFNAIRLLRFEEILVPSAWQFGQVVALERPGEGLPQAGALRLAPSNPGQWQEFVASLIAKAKFVLMTAGFTSGLRWEFQQLAASTESGKLSLVLLPDSKESMLSTWRQFSADASLPFSCPDDILTRTLAIRFAGQGKMPIFLTAERPSTSAFRCALNVCWLPADALPEPGTAAAAPAAKPLRLAAWAAAFATTILLSLVWLSSHPATAEDVYRQPWIVRAAAGDPSAMFVVGQSYQRQEKPSYWRARQWFFKASAVGSVDAMNELGRIYEEGEGAAQNFGKARRWYKKAADAGGWAAGTHLQLFERRQKQLDWEKAAAAGDASAMFQLGVSLGEGGEARPDPELAREWYEKAAARGHTEAMFRLGEFYSNGEAARPDYAQALEWYEKAASGGHARAALKLALLYHQGLAIPQDVELATRWYEKAATLGSPGAMLELGVFYQNGEGVAQDYGQARMFYESCIFATEQACRGRSGCGNQAGGFWRQRESLEEQELSESVRSATFAMYNLGVIYYRGLGVPQDYGRALHWFGESADHQNAMAMVGIANLYENGYGVPQDYDEARAWLSKAADLGSAEAERNLERLNSRAANVSQR